MIVDPVHLAQIVGAHHIGMGDPAGQLDLLLEAFEQRRVPSHQVAVQQLDGHLLVELPVHGAEHHAHAPLPQHALDLVAAGEDLARDGAARTHGDAGPERHGMGAGGAQEVHQLLFLLQLVDHAAERLGQLADLVAGGDPDFGVVVARSDLPGHRHQLPDRPGDLAGEQEGPDRGEDQAAEESQQDGLLQPDVRRQLRRARAERGKPTHRRARGGAEHAQLSDPGVPCAREPEMMGGGVLGSEPVEADLSRHGPGELRGEGARRDHRLVYRVEDDEDDLRRRLPLEPLGEAAVERHRHGQGAPHRPFAHPDGHRDGLVDRIVRLHPDAGGRRAAQRLFDQAARTGEGVAEQLGGPGERLQDALVIGEQRPIGSGLLPELRGLIEQVRTAPRLEADLDAGDVGRHLRQGPGHLLQGVGATVELIGQGGGGGGKAPRDGLAGRTGGEVPDGEQRERPAPAPRPRRSR